MARRGAALKEKRGVECRRLRLERVGIVLLASACAVPACATSSFFADDETSWPGGWEVEEEEEKEEAG